MGSIHSSMTMQILELQTVLHHSYVPEYGYYLHVKPHMAWSAFTELMGESEWGKCTQCRRTWDIVSTLSDTKGQPVIFRDSLNVYPEYTHDAITKFKESFRSTEFTDKICFHPHAKSFNDGMNFGRETTDGHVHLYLESNLPELDKEQLVTTVSRQRMIKLLLPQLEAMSVDWTPEFFKKASQAKYDSYGGASHDNMVLKDFCSRMANSMDIVKASPRMLRPLLIQEINNICACYDNEDDVRQLVKIFRRRSRIEYVPRVLIFRNFILPKGDIDAGSYEWPTGFTYSECIAAISLRNWLHTQKDAAVSCLMMGIAPPISTDDKEDYEHYALGKALRMYYEGVRIELGTNQHRLETLFYYLTNNMKSMPGLSTVEACVLMIMSGDETPGKTKGLSDSTNSATMLAGFLDAPIGQSSDETLYNALVAFTSCPPTSSSKQEEGDLRSP